MEYGFEKAEGRSVEIVRWKPGSRPRKVNLLTESGGLDELGRLADAPVKEVVRWVSKWGLLGFRPSSELISEQGLVHVITLGNERVHDSGNQIAYAYEPLPLILKAARIARSVSALCSAIRIQNGDERQRKLAELIRMNPNTGTRFVRREPRTGELIRDSPEIEMSILGVPIGLHKVPKTPVEWTSLALEGLAGVTDQCLSSEFSLYWSEPTGLRRKITCGWKVRSLLGGLFLKMASQLRETRSCIVCGKPLSNLARSHARACGPTCRKQLSRNPQ